MSFEKYIEGLTSDKIEMSYSFINSLEHVWLFHGKTAQKGPEFASIAKTFKYKNFRLG
jgi:hypothetical protein